MKPSYTAQIDALTRPAEADGYLVQRVDPKTGTKKWALVSRKKRRVLKWFNRKPSAESIKEQEKRIRYFKHQQG
jgi:hypothetical protein